MKTDFIHRSPSSSRLILIFAGWSTGPALYHGITREGWDVAVCHGYDDFSLPGDFLKPYSTIILYAWSFGVFAAMQALRHHNVTTAYAINGTGAPVDDTYGIPTGIFDGTLKGLSPMTLTKFRRRMAGSTSALDQILPMLDPAPDIESLRSQLDAIATEYDHSRSKRQHDTLPWRKVFISTSDHIIPAEAQKRYWHNHPLSPEIIQTEGAHYLPLDNIINATLPTPEKVGHRFQSALDTYNDQAKAQRIIASHLTGMIPPGTPQEGALVEIGAGAGLLTNMYADRLRPRSATFVDLYKPHQPFGIAPHETYICRDAEQWFDTAPSDTLDIIISASTIHWFADPGRFLSNAYRTLKDGGLLIVSTYVEGNLGELDTGRPSPLPYLKAEQLAALASDIFGPDVITRTEEIKLTFATPREALMHLKLTGVGGSARNGASLGEMLRALTPADPAQSPTLTFRPMYLIAKKRKPQ